MRVSDTHAVRRSRLAAALAAADIDAAVVTRLVNVRYLTGFTGSNGALLLHADGSAVLATDGRYTTQAARQAPDVDLLVERDVAPALAHTAGRGRLGFEEHDVTVAAYDTLAAAAPGSELVRLGPAVETLRAVKDAAEVDALRRAAAVADRAFAELLPRVAAGRTEREVARELDELMRAYGAVAPSFETIVATGENSAVPHHRPTERSLARGDLVKFDFGALVDGYHSDMTRTVVLGEPADWQREIYDVVRVAQRAGRHALAPGVRARDVDTVARAQIVDAGYGEQFPHGLGHGVGLEIHEAPMIGPGSGDTVTLDAGMPVTVEPGVYLPGRGGVRIEDTLVVRDGEPELLTNTTKDLQVL